MSLPESSRANNVLEGALLDQQRLCLGLDIRTKVDRVLRIAACHESQLSRGVVDKHIDEVIPTDDVIGLLSGLVVACAKLLSIDALERSVCVADEVEQEENRRVGVWRLHERMRFEGTGEGQY